MNIKRRLLTAAAVLGLSTGFIASVTQLPASAALLNDSWVNTVTGTVDHWYARGTIQAGACTVHYEAATGHANSDGSPQFFLSATSKDPNTGVSDPDCADVLSSDVWSAVPGEPSGAGAGTSSGSGARPWASTDTIWSMTIVACGGGQWAQLDLSGSRVVTNSSSTVTNRTGGTYSGTSCQGAGQPYAAGSSNWIDSGIGQQIIKLRAHSGSYATGSDQVESATSNGHTNTLTGSSAVTYGSNFLGTGWVQGFSVGGKISIAGISSTANTRHFELAMTNPFGSVGATQKFTVSFDGGAAETIEIPYTPQSDWTNWSQGVVLVGLDHTFTTSTAHSMVITRSSGGSGSNVDSMRWVTN